jgi:predicted nuclease with TOPRIM domain
VSNPGDNGGPPIQEVIGALEGAVGQALERLAVVTRRAEAAEKKSAELNELMKRFSGSPAEGGEILTRLKHLEDENAELRSRLQQGRAGVERLLAKIRFLENQKR